MSHSEYPRYSIASFSQKETPSHFYITRLEDLVQNFQGIDKPHAHTFYMIMAITQGSGTHTIDFKTHTVQPHQLYFLTPQQVHQWNLSNDIKGYNLFFDPNLYKARFGNRLYAYPFYHSNQYSPLIQPDSKEAYFLETILEHLYQEYKHHQTHHQELILSHLHIVLEKALLLHERSKSDQRNNYYDRIRQFEELIESQFLTTKKIQDYASQMNISPNHLNAICKEALGKTASQLLQERVIVEAKRLLLHTNKSAKEISFQLGFDDSSYFNRFFKQNAGQTPLEFRQHNS